MTRETEKNWQTQWTPKDLEKVDGFLWPPIALKYRDRYHKHAPDMLTAMKYVKSWDVVIQAGGNIGAWPAWLVKSKKFRDIYTFEPDPMNFYCLARNVWQNNVHKFQAALGEGGPPVKLSFHAGNIGAHHVHGAGAIPQITIDSLGLESCGLIVLDVEGYELPALRGARATLNAFRPVLMLENRGHGDKYGHGTWEDLLTFIGGLGYKHVDQVSKDAVFSCE